MPVPKNSVLRSTRNGERDTANIRVSVLSRSLHSKRNTMPTRDRSSDVTSSSASVYSARSTFSTATNSVRRSTMADRPSINQWVAKLAEDHVPIHEPIEFLLEAKSETDVSRSLNKVEVHIFISSQLLMVYLPHCVRRWAMISNLTDRKSVV